MKELETPSSLSAEQLAELITRFHQLTGISRWQARQFLTQFPPAERVRFVEMAESNQGQLHDPIEDDPKFRSQFEAIQQEAEQAAEAWYQQQLLELEMRSPATAELFEQSPGLNRYRWDVVKRLMWERCKIRWRSPAELNPWCSFD
jgi:hypothetical protein